jgi:hypothetical protein
MKEYNCNTIQEMATIIEELKDDFLFSFNDDGMSPEAEQFYLMAIHHLNLVKTNLKMASYRQMKKE